MAPDADYLQDTPPEPVHQGIADTLKAGVILSLACQVGVAAVFALFGSIFGLRWVAIVWSIPQWLVVVPLSRTLNRQGKPRTARGLARTSVAGLLVNVTGLILAAILTFDIPC